MKEHHIVSKLNQDLKFTVGHFRCGKHTVLGPEAPGHGCHYEDPLTIEVKPLVVILFIYIKIPEPESL